MRRCAANHTRRTARSITRLYDQALDPCGLTVMQFTVLVALAQHAFDSVTAMADRLGHERSSLSRNLSRLEKRGLVRREEAGRSRQAVLTDAGVAKIEEAYPYWREAQSQVEDALGADQWEETREALQRLAAASAS